MNTNYCIAFLLSATILLPLIYIYRLRRDRKKAANELPDDQPIPDEITPMAITGQSIFLRNEEKEIWKTLTNQQRKNIIDNQRKNIKDGLWFKVYDADGICTGIVDRKEAIAQGIITPDERDTIPAPTKKR